MATEWRTNGEFIEAVVDLEDGSQPQVFRGRTEREVADKLLEAQTHASRRIAQLRAEIRPDPATAEPATRPLSAGERMQIANDITDPARSDDAVERILAAKGVPLAEVQGILRDKRESDAAANAAAETTRFVEATPDWYPSAHNKMALANYMTANRMAFTARNFGLAFETLQGAGLLQPKPIEDTPTPTDPEQRMERIAPSSSRPRTTLSTGIRASDGRSTAPTQQRPKYTRRDIDRLSADEYKHRLLTEPGFAQAVEAAR